ncbi:bifunctional folylpolyglutamate synthase/dihydrofolate synthase, partial [Candidatus Omnitrophota bacterium]
MNYLRAEKFLNSFVNYERLTDVPDRSAFKLKRVKNLLSCLGNPQQNLPAIHVVGSKGKGSTCVFTAQILSAAGFKVGLYTSPHLLDLRERIRIVQPKAFSLKRSVKDKIPKADFAKLITKIKPDAQRLRQTELGALTYYEILTTLAFLYFKEQKCDFVVLETGIGGRLDATNVISALVCAIAPISYEHTQLLGKSLGKIAAEKAAIIKDSRQIVISAPQRAAALKVIKSRTKKIKATLFRVGADIQINKRAFNLQGQCFDLQGIFERYSGLKIGLLGEHQLVNAAVACGACESLRYHGVRIPA